jgi:hypothetical protein
VIVGLNHLFTAIFKPAGNLDRSAAQIDQRAAAMNVPGQNVGSIIQRVIRAQRVVEHAIRVTGNGFIYEGIKELADMSGKRAIERCLQAAGGKVVVDDLAAIALAVHEAGIEHPAMRKLECCTGHVANSPDNRIGTKRAKLRQTLIKTTGRQGYTKRIERVISWNRQIHLNPLVLIGAQLLVTLDDEVVVKLQVIGYIKINFY